MPLSITVPPPIGTQNVQRKTQKQFSTPPNSTKRPYPQLKAKRRTPVLLFTKSARQPCGLQPWGFSPLTPPLSALHAPEHSQHLSNPCLPELRQTQARSTPQNHPPPNHKNQAFAGFSDCFICNSKATPSIIFTASLLRSTVLETTSTRQLFT